jgi:hypothetical protein
MCLRTSSALAALLAACAEASPPPPGEAVACAIGEGAALAPDCTLEQVAGGGEIVLHHPDGGFRRFRSDPATGGLVPGDGAEVLVPEAGDGDALAFAIGTDRYRIPLSMLGPPATSTSAR